MVVVAGPVRRVVAAEALRARGSGSSSPSPALDLEVVRLCIGGINLEMGLAELIGDLLTQHRKVTRAHLEKLALPGARPDVLVHGDGVDNENALGLAGSVAATG
jgi:hypothetical protein